MSDNKFENQVQHLMDELKFTPSEEVWPAIKSRIRHKRRRRFFFFLIPVMAGLLFTGYYFLIKTNNLPVSQNATDAPVQKIEKTAPGNNNLAGNIPVSKNSNVIQPDETGSKPFDNGIEQPKEKVYDELTKMGPSANQFPITTSMQAEESKIPDDTKVQIMKSELVDQTQQKISIESAIDQKLDESNKIQSSVAQIIYDSVTHHSDKELSEKIPDSVILLKDTAKVVQIEKDSGSKWVWGIHVAAGVSKSGSSVLTTNVTMDYSSSPGFPGLNTSSKQTEAGYSFEAGVLVQKQITKRSSILTGLQYSYSSDRLLAGSRYDSTLRLQNSLSSMVNNYYRGNDQWYTNRYHFLELPVHYQYQLLKISKVPVHLQGGLIFSHLVSSNGLVYDPALSGIYFHDKKLFNRSSISFSSGLSFQVNSHKKLKWNIGPQIKAGLTSLRKSSNDHNQYLLSGGLRVNLFLD